LVNREDTIHIKIKLDIDEEDKQLITNVSEDLAKTDEQKAASKSTEPIGVEEQPETKKDREDQHKRDELQDREEEKILQDIKKLEKEIKQIKKENKKNKEKTLEGKRKELETKKDRLLLQRFKEGNVGKIQQFSSEHFGNLRRVATNPAQFILGAFTKQLGKAGGALAKGGLIGIIALLVYETILFVLDQLMQPGRWLDRRFKRIARLETMNFYERTLQEEIRHGYQEIRVTTQQGLRGGASQVNGNFFEFSSGATGIIQSSPYRSSQDIYQSQNATGTTTDSQGNPRRRTVSGRFG
jgi:flagellar motility protein MotE (MotC chaperone)